MGGGGRRGGSWCGCEWGRQFLNEDDNVVGCLKLESDGKQNGVSVWKFGFNAAVLDWDIGKHCCKPDAVALSAW